MATRYIDKDGVIAVIETADHNRGSVVFKIGDDYFVEDYADFIKRFNRVLRGD